MKQARFPDAQARRARRGELATVLRLASAFYVEDGFATPAAELRHNLRVLFDSDDARVAVAESRENIVGFAITTLHFGLEQGRSAELEDLYVEPAHRRRGIAGALIDDSAAWARSRGCRAHELVVAPNGQDVGHLLAFYGRRGFTDEGRRLLTRTLDL
jgi:ribosomal protein S18 acetylase RimI-like enzyme